MNAFTKDLIAITNRGDIQEAFETSARLNLPHTPLFYAAASGLITLAFFHHPEAEFPRKLLKPTKRPLIVLVGDDPPERFSHAIGPEPWMLRPGLSTWEPRFAVVHGTGAHQQQYREMVQAALIMHRLLVVETGSAEALAWASALGGLCPTSVWLPTTGTHPVAETVQ